VFPVVCARSHTDGELNTTQLDEIRTSRIANQEDSESDGDRRRMLVEPVLDQKCVVDCGDDGEDKSGAQEGSSRNPDPLYRVDK
jgi:hypothetical protein